MFDAIALLNRRRRTVLIVTICLWIGAFVLTHIPKVPSALAEAGDVALHTVGFWGLASWFLLTLAGYRVRTFWRVLIVLAVMAVYAALDEHTQPFFGRTCDLLDWENDMIGTAIAVVMWEIILAAFRKKSRPTRIS
jgi:VanZ family protein